MIFEDSSSRVMILPPKGPEVVTPLKDNGKKQEENADNIISARELYITLSVQKLINDDALMRRAVDYTAKDAN
ncbi:hypothetical protein FRB98_008765, partial [Tulasnella sp. 332]